MLVLCGIIVGAILEVIVAVAGMGTAVALFPVVKRQNEGVALGFVGSALFAAEFGARDRFAPGPSELPCPPDFKAS